jgi:hypothetical protein|tara:strand:+ start:253 stop:384 length:132 start_codon:yes stop_codon:yes gene_type:complete
MLIFDPPEVELPEDDWYYQNQIEDAPLQNSTTDTYETVASSGS